MFAIFKRHLSSTKNILVVNCGSSTIKFQVVDPTIDQVRTRGIVDRIGSQGAVFHHKSADGEEVKEDIPNCGGNPFRSGFEKIAQTLTGIDFFAVGHRVVHGGNTFQGAVVIDDNVKTRIAALVPLAPLHNPAHLMGIEFMQTLYPSKPQVAVFDTAFHQTIPDYAHRYALPDFCYEKYGIRKYGFHGTSHQYAVGEVAKTLGIDAKYLSVISAHLGNGCSVAATKHGKSLDTSMGFSPLEGLVMGHRSGDVDPAIIKYLVDVSGMTLAATTDMLNKQSGLKGLSGYGDSRDVEEAYKRGDPKAKLARRCLLLPIGEIHRELCLRSVERLFRCLGLLRRHR